MVNETTPLLDARNSDRTSKQAPPAYAYLVAGIATINSVNLGFDVGVSSGIGVLMQEDMQLSDWEVGLFMGSIHYMAAVGSLFSHYFCDHLGRRLTFTVSQLLFLVGVCLLVTSTGFEQVLLSRIFTGFAIGIALAIDPLYIGEVAPASHRGQLTSFCEIAINVGILLGFIANWVFADLPPGQNWRAMPLCGAIGPSTLLILSLTVIPESPRWLSAQGRYTEAEEIIRRTHNADEDVDALMTGIRSQAREEEHVLSLGWRPLLQPDAKTRWMIMVGIGVAFAQHITGAESVVMYSPEIFRHAGIATQDSELFAMTICLGIVKTACVVVSAMYVDGFGRRPLLLLGMAGICISQLMLSLGFAIQHNNLTVAGVFSFMCCYGFGIGPVCWLLASEVFPLKIRGKAMSLATAANRISSATVALTFLPLSDLLGLSGYFLLFAVLSMLVGIIQFFTVPETKGKTLEMMEASFDASNFKPSLFQS